MQPIHFCVFAHTEDIKPKAQSKPWNVLSKDLTRHRETSVDKNKSGRIDIPLISLVTYKPGTLRAKYNVETVNAAAIDIDYITPVEWENIHSILEKNQISSFWYTTYSHRFHEREDNYKLRLVIELSRPVTAKEWAQIFSFFQEYFKADTNAKDASRMFFGPYIPIGTQELHFTGIQDGNPLDVESLLSRQISQPTVDDRPPDPTIIVTKEMLTRLSQKLSRRSDPHALLSSQMLRYIRDGLPFTEEGHRDEAVFRYIIAAIVKEWPGVDTEKLTDLATPSLTINGGVTPDDFKYKVEREKKNRLEINEKLWLAQKEKHEKSLAKGNINRQIVGIDSFYINETLPQLNVEAMYSKKQFEIPITQAKVVQHQSDFYFWCNGSYIGPIQRKGFIQAAIKYLSPFEEIEKELFDPYGNLKEINIDNFISIHGTFVKEVIFALGSSKTSLSNDALVLPYYPPLPTKPDYSWKVDQWIKFLFGGTAFPEGASKHRVEWAEKWLCHYQNHDTLLPAILLVGKTGAGKGLFAEFLAQAYEIPATVAPMNLLYATGTENDVYPIMVADEEFPDCSSAQLREGITAKTHVLKKKYQNIRKVVGYVRHILILNDADRIKTFDVGVEAQQATAERFMFVPVTEACRDYLEALCRSNEHLQPGELQRHIAWMQEQNQYSEVSKGRFAVEVPADNQAFFETFYRQKDRFEVLNILVDFICRESYASGLQERYQHWPIEVTETEVKIRPTPFYEYCEDKITTRSKSMLGSILKSIAEPINGPSERYYRLKTHHLFRWAQIAMEYSDIEIERHLKQTTKSKVDSVVTLETGVLN